MLEKDGDQLDWSCDKQTSATDSQGKEEYPRKKKRKKTKWIGHILHRNYLPKHVTEGKIEGMIEIT